MSEKHIGKVIQVIGPVLDIQFKDGELPELLNAIEIDNHGQKLVVEVAQLTGDNVARCIAIEDEYGNTPAQRAELDWLLYNKPLEYAQLVLSGEIEHYLSLGCDHGRLED